MCRYPPIQITNVVGFMRFPALLDFYATIKKNPELTYEPEVSVRYVSVPRLNGHGKVMAMRGGLEALGAKSEADAQDMLRQVYKKYEWVFDKPPLPAKEYVVDKKGNYRLPERRRYNKLK